MGAWIAYAADAVAAMAGIARARWASAFWLDRVGLWHCLAGCVSARRHLRGVLVSRIRAVCVVAGHTRKQPASGHAAGQYCGVLGCGAADLLLLRVGALVQY